MVNQDVNILSCNKISESSDAFVIKEKNPMEKSDKPYWNIEQICAIPNSSPSFFNNKYNLPEVYEAMTQATQCLVVGKVYLLNNCDLNID